MGEIASRFGTLAMVGGVGFSLRWAWDNELFSSKNKPCNALQRLSQASAYATFTLHTDAGWLACDAKNVAP